MTTLTIILGASLGLAGVLIVILTARIISIAEKGGERLENMAADYSKGLTELNRETVMSVERVAERAIQDVMHGITQITALIQPSADGTEAPTQELWTATALEPDVAPDWSASDPWLDESRDPNYVGGLAPGEEVIAGIPRPDLAGEQL